MVNKKENTFSVISLKKEYALDKVCVVKEVLLIDKKERGMPASMTGDVMNL